MNVNFTLDFEYYSNITNPQLLGICNLHHLVETAVLYMVLACFSMASLILHAVL